MTVERCPFLLAKQCSHWEEAHVSLSSRCLLQSPVFRLSVLGPSQLGRAPPEQCTVRDGDRQSRCDSEQLSVRICAARGLGPWRTIKSCQTYRTTILESTNKCTRFHRGELLIKGTCMCFHTHGMSKHSWPQKVAGPLCPFPFRLTLGHSGSSGEHLPLIQLPWSAFLYPVPRDSPSGAIAPRMCTASLPAGTEPMSLPRARREGRE